MEVTRGCVAHGEGTVSYRRNNGGGLPVVFIHGAGGDSTSFNAQLQGIGNAAVAVDLPWHGESLFPGAPAFKDYAPAVLAAVDSLGFSRFVAAGHSMGGGVVFELMKLCPERVAGAIFISAGATMPVNPAVLELIKNDYAAFCGLAAGMCFRPGGDAAGAAAFRQCLERTGTDIAYRDFLFCSRFDYRDDAASSDLPALILACGRDKMVSQKIVAALHESMVNSRLHIFPAAGHMPHIDEAQEMNRETESFISGLDRESSLRA